jgi:hypothetical protein
MFGSFGIHRERRETRKPTLGTREPTITVHFLKTGNRGFVKGTLLQWIKTHMLAQRNDKLVKTFCGRKNLSGELLNSLGLPVGCTAGRKVL